MTKEKRVCLLTGAGGRLGTAFCKAYASEYDIIAVYRNDPPQVTTQDQKFIDPLELSHDLPGNASPVFAIQADLAHDHELNRIVEIGLAHSGRIDLLVNSAAWSVWEPLLTSDLALDSMAHQFRINTYAPVKLASIIARTFWRNRRDENITRNCNVVNVSSIGGVYVYPDTGQSVYSTTKAALNHLTYHMASEFWSIGVRVNATAPNTFPAIVPIEAAAETIVKLDQASVTGKIMVLDHEAEYYL
jgi:NAD(P)-dependent dehydrogenase (short-subunit alcohol dehydrogenase family)